MGLPSVIGCGDSSPAAAVSGAGRPRPSASRIGGRPITKYWMTMPARFENRMYTASPAGNWNVKKPNITGIIQSMIWLV